MYPTFIPLLINFGSISNVVVPAILPLVSSSATNILCNELDFILCNILLAYSLSSIPEGNRLFKTSKNPLSISLSSISRIITRYYHSEKLINEYCYCLADVGGEDFIRRIEGYINTI